MASTLWRYGSFRIQAHQGAGRRKCPAEKNVCEPGHGTGHCQIHHRKKALKPCDKRRIIDELRRERPRDTGKACRLLRQAEGSAYTSKKTDEGSLIVEPAGQPTPLDGFWKCYDRLRNAAPWLITNGCIGCINK